MADQATLPKANDRSYQTEPEQAGQLNQEEAPGEAGAPAQPDQPAPRGRMPLFGI